MLSNDPLFHVKQCEKRKRTAEQCKDEVDSILSHSEACTSMPPAIDSPAEKISGDQHKPRSGYPQRRDLHYIDEEAYAKRAEKEKAEHCSKDPRTLRMHSPQLLLDQRDTPASRGCNIII